jgi:hypothetical protein
LYGSPFVGSSGQDYDLLMELADQIKHVSWAYAALIVCVMQTAWVQWPASRLNCWHLAERSSGRPHRTRLCLLVQS